MAYRVSRARRSLGKANRWLIDADASLAQLTDLSHEERRDTIAALNHVLDTVDQLQHQLGTSSPDADQE